MTKTWVIADTHFGHANIIRYAKRPFASVEEMNEALIENWNSVVQDHDIVWHLGDIYFTSGLVTDAERLKILRRLKGRKKWILGNHDNAKDLMLLNFFGRPRFWTKKGPAVLSHAPLHPVCLEFGQDSFFKVNIHGHIHEKNICGCNETYTIQDPRYVNVSVEQINYTPVDLDEIIAKYKE